MDVWATFDENADVVEIFNDEVSALTSMMNNTKAVSVNLYLPPGEIDEEEKQE